MSEQIYLTFLHICLHLSVCMCVYMCTCAYIGLFVCFVGISDSVCVNLHTQAY